MTIKTNLNTLKRCQNGENAAYKELYMQFAKPFLNISYRILNNSAEAEDVLQEAFIKAFTRIKEFENENTFGAWLKKVVINQSIDIIRKRKQTAPAIELSDNIEDDEPKEEELIYTIENVRESILELPDGYRLVLTLFLFENYSHKEIAATLNISEGTSKSQYNRAKQRLIQIIRQKTLIHEQ